MFAIFILGIDPQAVAAARLSSACKKGIKQDMLQNGYAAGAITLLNKNAGSCDGETCNPDNLKLRVAAEAITSGKRVELIVDAFGPARRDGACSVWRFKVTRSM